MPCVTLVFYLIPTADKSAAHRLDIVAVGVDQERGVVVRAVVGARTGLAIVLATGLEARAVEGADRGVVGSAEREVRAAAFQFLLRVEPQRRRAVRSKACSALVARTQDIAKGRERRAVKARAGIEVSNSDSDVVEHDDLRVGRTSRRRKITYSRQ